MRIAKSLVIFPATRPNEAVFAIGAFGNGRVAHHFAAYFRLYKRAAYIRPLIAIVAIQKT
jgi:hypothetical protein